MSELPNILYLHSHDTGRYVQPYGEQVPMPNVQALADQGVLFRQAFCAAPTCSASRACLLTGQYGQSNGMLGLAHRGWSLRDYRHHIVHTLRDVGYTSTLIGEQHISKEPDVIGYDEVMKIPTTRVDTVAPLAMEVLRRPRERPLFLSVGFFETHREFLGPGSLQRRPLLQAAQQPSRHAARFAPTWPRSRRARARSTTASAWCSTSSTPQGLDDTLIIFTTDHGMPFPGAKATLYDRGLGVTLILRGPEPFDGGRVIDALVSHIDIYPTVCEYLGIERPPFLQGVSLLALLRGARRRARARRSSRARPGTPHMSRSARSAPRATSTSAAGASVCTPVLREHRRRPEQGPAAAQRLGRARDPQRTALRPPVRPQRGEQPARGSRPTRTVLADLRGRLERWMRDTDDPLLAGHVDPPPGVEINLPDQLSATEPTTRIELTRRGCRGAAAVRLSAGAGSRRARRVARSGSSSQTKCPAPSMTSSSEPGSSSWKRCAICTPAKRSRPPHRINAGSASAARRPS